MFDYPAPIYIASGTIIAAFISGLISFVRLVLVKDQDVSKVRRKWIDELREELSRFMSAAGQMPEVMDFEKTNNPELIRTPEGKRKLFHCLDDHRRFVEIYHRIKLRLNLRKL